MSDNGPRTAARRRLVVAACAAATGLLATTGIAAPAAPPRPQLDVYFVVDATASMGGTRAAVAKAVDQLVARLRTRTTLRWGVAEFRDADAQTYLLDGPAYRQHAPVTRSGGDLGRIRYGGGGDTPEGHLIALDGVLGNAHEPWTIKPAPAGFAPRAKKIVVLISDAPAKRGQPSMADVTGRLRSAGVFVAGLAVGGTSDPELDRTAADLREIAERTVTVAKAPADCDGDGRRDFVRGSALVCPLGSAGTGDYRGFADALYARFWR